jgi:protein TonB
MPNHRLRTAISFTDERAGANVIALPRPGNGAGSALPVVAEIGDRGGSPGPGRGTLWALLLLGSMAAHAGVIAVLAYRAQPLPSAGISAITVEIVFGDNAAAGLANSRGQEGAAEVKPAEAPLAEAMSMEPNATPPLAAAEAPVAAKPAKAASTVPPAQAALAVPDALPEMPAQTSPSPSGVERAPREPQEVTSKPIAAERRALRPSRTSSAGGIGRGGSMADVRYHGLVAAHLARHKRFPAHARRRGERGSAGIDFQIDGRGRVTAVRIVRSSGHDILDQAAEAMVWRASPFPAPPDGRPQRFSVPVSYSIP